MPRMTKRWRNAALIMALLGFTAVALRLLVRQYAPTTTGCAAAPNCFRLVNADPVATLISAGVNAAIWFGAVYLVFLVVRAIRR